MKAGFLGKKRIRKGKGGGENAKGGKGGGGEQAWCELAWKRDVPRSGEEAEEVSCAAQSKIEEDEGCTLLNGSNAVTIEGSEALAELRQCGGRAVGTFLDLSTGIRVRLLLSGSESSQHTVLLLHDAGENADCFDKLTATLSNSRPFWRVVAFDMRGHGRSGRSAEARYSPDCLVEDVVQIILHFDLYKRPVLVAGQGVGALVGVLLAAKYPKLTAGVMLLDPPSDVRAVAFHPWQAAQFRSLEHAIAVVSSRGWGHEPRKLMHTSWSLVRTLRSVHGEELYLGPMPLVPEMDSRWCLCIEQEAYESALAALTCRVRIIRGERSHMCTEKGMELLVDAMTEEEDTEEEERRCQIVTLPDALHWVVTEHAETVTEELILFMDDVVDEIESIDPATRRPELLGLRPLQIFDTIEEARKVLSGRKVPSRKEVEYELRRIKAEERGIVVDSPSFADVSDDEDEGDARMTALAKDSSEYFGFVT